MIYTFNYVPNAPVKSVRRIILGGEYRNLPSKSTGGVRRFMCGVCLTNVREALLAGHPLTEARVVRNFALDETEGMETLKYLMFPYRSQGAEMTTYRALTDVGYKVTAGGRLLITGYDFGAVSKDSHDQGRRSFAVERIPWELATVSDSLPDFML